MAPSNDMRSGPPHLGADRFAWNRFTVRGDARVPDKSRGEPTTLTETAMKAVARRRTRADKQVQDPSLPVGPSSLARPPAETSAASLGMCQRLRWGLPRAPREAPTSGVASGMQDIGQWLPLLRQASVPVIVGGAVTVAFRYVPRFFLEIVIACTRDEDRRLACLEAIRLRRKDASALPSYLPPPIDRRSDDGTPKSVPPQRSRAGRSGRRPKQGSGHPAATRRGSTTGA